MSLFEDINNSDLKLKKYREYLEKELSSSKWDISEESRHFKTLIEQNYDILKRVEDCETMKTCIDSFQMSIVKLSTFAPNSTRCFNPLKFAVADYRNQMVITIKKFAK